MGLFDKLFGKKPAAESKPAATPARPSGGARPGQPVGPFAPAKPASASAGQTDLIQVFDAYGRPMQITKEQWRIQILPGTIQKAWNSPDELYQVIVHALQDGFRADVLAAAEHLFRTDTIRARGTNLWGVVLLEEKRLDEAEGVFQDFLKSNPPDGWIYLNLAKVFSMRGDEARADETLWRGLEIDPNMGNAAGWYFTRAKEKGGDAAGMAALERIAALPGSWRAQAWLAQRAIESHLLTKAKALFQEALAHAPTPKPQDLLSQMSADFGKSNHLKDLLEFTVPHYDATVHGLAVGNNLIKAYVDLGELDKASALVNALYHQKRPDWAQTLSFWTNEIAKKGVGKQSVPADQPLSVTLLAFHGPVWGSESSPIHAILPPASEGSPLIGIVGSSAETANAPGEMQMQLSNVHGKMSRAFPLLLAEMLCLGGAKAHAMIPWLVQDKGGFILYGKPLADGDAASFAGFSPDEKAEYIISSHLIATSEPWRFNVRLIRVVDGTCLGQVSHAVDKTSPVEMLKLAEMVTALLSEHGIVSLKPRPEWYNPPVGAWFTTYLVGLEDLMCFRCAVSMPSGQMQINNDRDMIDRALQVCIEAPTSCPARFVFVQSLSYLREGRPDIVAEYRERAEKLHKEKPIQSPEQEIVGEILAKVFA